MAPKILGIALIAAGLVLRHGVKRARQRGYVGPRHRRVHREVERLKFNLVLSSQFMGALICFAGAFLCLTHGTIHHF